MTSSWQTIPGDAVDLRAFVVEPDAAGADHVLIVVHENPGITEWRQQETRRMAADLGWAVVVMSTYSRIGGEPPPGPFETPEERRRAAFLAMPDEQVSSDLAVTAQWARARWGLGDRLPALLGFCSGGGQVLYTACTSSGLAACVVAIYGNVVLRGELTEDGQPIDRVLIAQRLDGPLQLHVGTEDVAVPLADVDRLEAELVRTDKTFEIHRYPGAGHVFSDETHPNYDRDATAAMWPRIYAFLHEHTP
jgi:carboxymethylenebutenolidase